MKKVIALLVILMACTTNTTEQPRLIPTEGPLPDGMTTTQDGYTIAYDEYPNKGKPGVILLHMMRRSRTDWESVATWLQKKGYAVIAIDLRGHGHSSGNRDEFTAEDYNNMVNDVAAAKGILEGMGADTSRVSIIGASIGANVAYKYAAKDKSVKTIILLSPGMSYQGVELTETLTQPVFIVASKDDPNSAIASGTLAQRNNAELLLYQDAGHGTNMFQKPDLATKISNWLQEYS